MNTTFEELLARKKAAREMRARQTWEAKVRLIERMKEQLDSRKKLSKSSIASKLRDDRSLCDPPPKQAQATRR